MILCVCVLLIYFASMLESKWHLLFISLCNIICLWILVFLDPVYYILLTTVAGAIIQFSILLKKKTGFQTNVGETAHYYSTCESTVNTDV